MVSLLQSTVRQCGQCLFLCICMSVCQGGCVWKYRSSQAGRLVWLVISPLRPGPVTLAVLAVMTDWPSRPHMGCCADPLWQNHYTAGGQMGWALTDLTCVIHLFRCIAAEQKGNRKKHGSYTSISLSIIRLIALALTGKISLHNWL